MRSRTICVGEQLAKTSWVVMCMCKQVQHFAEQNAHLKLDGTMPPFAVQYGLTMKMYQNLFHFSIQERRPKTRSGPKNRRDKTRNGLSKRRKSTTEEEDNHVEHAEGLGGRNKRSLKKEWGVQAKRPKTVRKPHHLPDELFKAALSSRAMKRKVEEDDVPLDRPLKKQRPSKSKSKKDIVVG